MRPTGRVFFPLYSGLAFGRAIRECIRRNALSKLASALRARKPHDFVFSDFWMPRMNGLELIEKLRADSRFRHLPVFAVTADMEFRNDARSSLFNGIILKPLTYAKLMETFAHSTPTSAERS